MKEKISAIIIFITAETEEEADKIADVLIKQKKAACVSIIPRLKSLFWWRGKIDSADEALLLVKTEECFLDDVVKLVKGLHSYEVPEVVAVPVLGGNEEYLEWIRSSLPTVNLRLS